MPASARASLCGCGGRAAGEVDVQRDDGHVGLFDDHDLQAIVENVFSVMVGKLNSLESRGGGGSLLLDDVAVVGLDVSTASSAA